MLKNLIRQDYRKLYYICEQVNIIVPYLHFYGRLKNIELNIYKTQLIFKNIILKHIFINLY